MMYLIAFGIDGYEAMEAVDPHKRESEDNVIKKLKGEEISDTLGPILMSMSLRFRFNSHRRIEVYTMFMKEDTAEIVRDALIENNEAVKDMIREKGESLSI